MQVLQLEFEEPQLSRARAERGGQPHQGCASPSRGVRAGDSPSGTATVPMELSSVPQPQKPRSVVWQFPFSRLLQNTELPPASLSPAALPGGDDPSVQQAGTVRPAEGELSPELSHSQLLLWGFWLGCHQAQPIQPLWLRDLSWDTTCSSGRSPCPQG